MVCRYCRKVIPDDSKFCTGCGKHLLQMEQRICHFCGSKLDADAIFCTVCGQRLIEQQVQIKDERPAVELKNGQKAIIEHRRGIAEIYEDKLVLKKEGSLFWRQSGSQRTYYFDQIKAIEMNRKRPLMDDPFIEINIGGQVTTQGGSGFENSIPFKRNDDMEKAYETIMYYYNEYKKKSNVPQNTLSIADEIKKFKELLDSGVISKADFDKKVNELLHMK